MKKVLGIVGLGITFACAQVQAQAKEAVVDDGVAITFVPIYTKARDLVAIELVSSVKYKKRYIALEQAVMKNDWRPIPFASNPVNPGKCTVMVIPSGYDVDCRLWQKNTEERDRKQVKTVEEIIVLVGAFSKKRSM